MSAKTLDYLQKPIPQWNPKSWWYASLRGGLLAAAPLSGGIRTGLKYGFDSGVMLDYVYRNKAQGWGPVGRLIDRIFLNSPGWVGIRNRGDLLRKILGDEIRYSGENSGSPIALTDLACGGGQYVLGAIADSKHVDVKATLRDYREENLMATRENAEKCNVKARIEKGDAFAEQDLMTLPPADLVVVSGLHEIIDDDALVRNHFQQISRLLKKKGRLLLTTQPDHPQAEFIARVLTSHTGNPWAMRLRSIDLTRSWLEMSGFRVLDVVMEEKGIFGVIVAEKANA